MSSELYRIDKQEAGKWYAQFKWDGWRRPIYISDGQVNFYSKHDFQAKDLPPYALQQEFRDLGFPEGTAFDAEWMGKRCTAQLGGRHYFILFDLLYFNSKWMGDLPYSERYLILKNLVEKHKEKVDAPNIVLEPISELGFLAMFECSKSMPLTEGIVLKGKDSKLKGNVLKSAENGFWLKCKWRQ
jgi:ATP-dependent DNA ligase